MKYEDFMKELKADSKLAEEFKKKLEGVKPANEEEAWKAACEAAKDLGYDIDASEFAIASRSKAEVSEAELDTVSGGIREWCIVDFRCIAAANTCDFNDECWNNERCSGDIGI